MVRPRSKSSMYTMSCSDSGNWRSATKPLRAKSYDAERELVMSLRYTTVATTRSSRRTETSSKASGAWRNVSFLPYENVPPRT